MANYTKTNTHEGCVRGWLSKTGGRKKHGKHNSTDLMDGQNEKVIEKSGQLCLTTPVHKQAFTLEGGGREEGGWGWGWGVYGGLD